MNKLNIESTESSPKVMLDPESFHFEISGESRPEDVRKFYEPILSWMDDFNGHLNGITSGGNNKEVKFNFIFEYFNSSSAKYIMDIMSKLRDLADNNPNADVKVCWHYDELDEDMLEAGQEFENITEIPFKYIVIEE